MAKIDFGQVDEATEKKQQEERIANEMNKFDSESSTLDRWFSQSPRDEIVVFSHMAISLRRIAEALEKANKISTQIG